MRTGEIIDLAKERRLTAVLDFSARGGELLILNGGSRAEEFVVVTTSKGMLSKPTRDTYCIDSGTSMQLLVPLAPNAVPSDLALRIIGGHGEMMLRADSRPVVSRRLASVRSAASTAAALLLLLLAGGRIDSPTVFASADPEPAPAEAPLVKPTVSLHVPAGLPNVTAQANPIVHKPVAALRAVEPFERHVTFEPAAAPVAFVPSIKHSPIRETPAPQMTDLRVPSTAKSGDFIPVSFGAVAHQVKIVASIGPTIVSKTIIGAQHGVIAIRSPKSDLDSRIMTVRAYAQNGNRSASLQAMVVLVRP